MQCRSESESERSRQKKTYEKFNLMVLFDTLSHFFFERCAQLNDEIEYL